MTRWHVGGYKRSCRMLSWPNRKWVSQQNTSANTENVVERRQEVWRAHLDKKVGDEAGGCYICHPNLLPQMVSSALSNPFKAYFREKLPRPHFLFTSVLRIKNYWCHSSWWNVFEQQRWHEGEQRAGGGKGRPNSTLNSLYWTHTHMHTHICSPVLPPVVVNSIAGSFSY